MAQEGDAWTAVDMAAWAGHIEVIDFLDKHTWGRAQDVTGEEAEQHDPHTTEPGQHKAVILGYYVLVFCLFFETYIYLCHVDFV
jgi:hypothetical protein